MPSPSAQPGPNGRKDAEDGRARRNPRHKGRISPDKRGNGDHAEDPDYLFEAVIAGAAGYVLKGATPEQLTDAVRQVLDGEFLFNQKLTIDLLRSMAEREKPAAIPPSGVAASEESLSEPLTARETEILRLLAQGQTNPQIARNSS